MKGQIQFGYTFEAAHRFSQAKASRCTTPHGHSWRAVLGYTAFDQKLPENAMYEEFSKLKKHWKPFIQDTIDHSFFHHHEDPIVPELKRLIPDFRGLPFPGDPSTELIAACFLNKAMSWVEHSGEEFLIVPNSVIIQETATNSVSIEVKDKSELLENFPQLNQMDGWWNQPELESRWVSR